MFTHLRVWQADTLLGGTIFLLFLAITFYMVKRGGVKQLWHLLWLAALFAVILLKIPIIEERTHIILFGLFGFLSLRLFPLPLGLIICATMSASDELLQFYLADRVGDWRDVFLNLISTGVGGVLAVISRAASHKESCGKSGDFCE